MAVHTRYNAEALAKLLRTLRSLAQSVLEFPSLSTPGRPFAKMGAVPRFVVGQYVELYPTIPSSGGGSIPGGTRGIVREVDVDRSDDDIYLVGFLAAEQVTDESAWLREVDLFPG